MVYRQILDGNPSLEWVWIEPSRSQTPRIFFVARDAPNWWIKICRRFRVEQTYLSWLGRGMYLIVGTPNYMAPKVQLRYVHVQFIRRIRTKIWSLFRNPGQCQNYYANHREEEPHAESQIEELKSPVFSLVLPFPLIDPLFPIATVLSSASNSYLLHESSKDYGMETWRIWKHRASGRKALYYESKISILAHLWKILPIPTAVRLKYAWGTLAYNGLKSSLYSSLHKESCQTLPRSPPASRDNAIKPKKRLRPEGSRSTR